jgi:hypothetical protein
VGSSLPPQNSGRDLYTYKMCEAHKWGKLPKCSAGVGHCDEKLVITNISGTVPLSFVNHLDFLLSILPLIGVSLNITNPSWFSFYIPLLIEIFFSLRIASLQFTLLIPSQS